jgi:hypothetical protein
MKIVFLGSEIIHLPWKTISFTLKTCFWVDFILGSFLASQVKSIHPKLTFGIPSFKKVLKTWDDNRKLGMRLQKFISRHQMALAACNFHVRRVPAWPFSKNPYRSCACTWLSISQVVFKKNMTWDVPSSPCGRYSFLRWKHVKMHQISLEWIEFHLEKIFWWFFVLTGV